MKLFIKSKKSNWYFLFKVLIKILDCITPLLTLGFYWTDIEYNYTKWRMFK